LLRSTAWTDDCFRLLLSFHSLASTSFIYLFLGLFFDFLPSFFDLLEDRISEACLSSIPFRESFRLVCSNFLFFSYLEPSPCFLGRNFGMRVSCIYLALYNFFSYLQSVCQCENSSLSSVCIVVCKFLIVSFQVLARCL
jgi:hypothetical protein